MRSANGLRKFLLVMPVFMALLISGLPVASYSDTETICIDINGVTAVTDDTNAGNIGKNIVNSVFNTINTITNGVSQSFYQQIVGPNTTFQKVVSAVFLLYITMYGAMIITGFAGFRINEVIPRLFRIAFVYALISLPAGWTFFSTYISDPLIQSMNSLIEYFAEAAGNVYIPDTKNPAGLNASALSILAIPMGKVFAAKYMIAVISLLTTSPAGWLIAFILAWSALEFIFMVLGAMATYIKSIVGLSFLFGIAPIFIIFILFDKSRQIFFGWLNQVIGFILQPVLLFAFLSFYATLINLMLDKMLGAGTPNYCYEHWTFLPGLFDIKFWRAQNAANPGGGDWKGALPISMVTALYFMLVCHLGKTFSGFIEELAGNLSQGMGPGMVKSGDVSQWFKNNLTGGRGRWELATAFVAGAAANGRGLASVMGGRARPKDLGDGSSGGGGGPGNSPSPAPQNPTYMGSKLNELGAAANYRVNKNRAAIAGGLSNAGAAINQAAAPMRDYVGGHVQGVRDAADRVGGAASAVGAAVGNRVESAGRTLQGHSDALQKKAQDTASSVQTSVQGAYDSARNTIQDKTAPIVDPIRDAAQRGGERIQSGVDALGNKIDQTQQAIGDKANQVKDAVTGKYEQVQDTINTGVDKINTGVENIQNKTTAAVDRKVSSLSDRLAGGSEWRQETGFDNTPPKSEPDDK